MNREPAMFLHSAFRTPHFAILLVLPCVALLMGCGPDYPDCVPVSGKVTFEGEPVTQGTITFYPDGGRAAMGEIQPDGTYVLTTFEPGDGAVPGRHTVTIKSTEVSGAPAPTSFEEELAMGQGDAAGAAFAPADQIRWLVPESFSRRETSGLEAEVTRDAGSIDFALP